MKTSDTGTMFQRLILFLGNLFQRLFHQFVNLFANSKQVSSCGGDKGSNNGPAPNASNSEKPSSCRSDELEKIKGQLTSRGLPDLEVITIVGMGGIGKTTLARSIYEDTEISYHFHCRAWITVSQEYNLTNLFLGLLRSLGSAPDNASELGVEDLAHKLYKCLKGRRFLVVLDDTWNVETWNDFKSIFPNDNNGSRVILTTRHIEVAPDTTPHCMNCLSNEESWRLLLDEIFRGEPCNSNMVEIGQEIAGKCQGLPLAVMVVAGHLSKIEKKRDNWVDFAKKLDSLITGNQGQMMDILCLSYDCLPLRLKACFLYMGIFPKNSRIRVSKLIRLWNAVGLALSEDEAEKCLQDLIDRNLITVRKKGYDGVPKKCGIHDILWDLGMRQARKEGLYIFSKFNFRRSHLNFFYIFSKFIFRRSHLNVTNDMNCLMHLASSFRYPGHSSNSFLFALTFTCFRLLTVLDIQFMIFDHFPEILTNLVGLRYLELHTSDIPRSISKFCNLETLINRYKSWEPLLLPKEIWSLHHLRHLQLGKVAFDTSVCGTYASRVDGSSVLLLPDGLQTLSTISFCSYKQLVFSRIPNLKKLKIFDINGEEDDENLFSFLNNLVYFHRLQKLNLHFRRLTGSQQQIPWREIFPSSLKQLTLSGSCLQWESMNILVMLPNIEVLKLKRDAFTGETYRQTMEGSSNLRALVFEDLDIKQWIVETDPYPGLRHLIVRSCHFLEGIPYCFGEIPTLESIELVSCSLSIVESVKTIQQEQQSIGNDLQVRIKQRQV